MTPKHQRDSSGNENRCDDRDENANKFPAEEETVPLLRRPNLVLVFLCCVFTVGGFIVEVVIWETSYSLGSGDTFLMYPGKGPVPNWSWDRLKYYIYKEQHVFNEPPVHGPGFKDTAGKHLPKGVRIPDWKKYNVQETPELLEVQKRLAEKGLKNPWLRNDVWRYDPRLWGTYMDRSLFLFRYLKYGVAAFIVTESFAHLMGWRGDHGHHEEHHEDPYKLMYEMKKQ